MDNLCMNMKTGSLVKWLIYCSCGLHVIQGQASTCIDIQCDSNEFAEKECEIKEALYVINATVLKRDSRSSCTYEDGSANVDGSSGRYGFESNILWVKQGCRALFRVCYTGKTITQSTAKSSASTQTATTLLTDPPTSLQDTDTVTVIWADSTTSSEDTYNSHITKYATSTNVSGITYNKQRVDTTESQETQEHETSSLPISAVVIPVIVVFLGLALLGIFLWKKRRKSDQESCDPKQIPANRSSTNSNAYCVLNEPSNNKISANNAYSMLDAPQRTDNNYIVLGPEHSYASIHSEVKPDKRLENAAGTDEAVSPKADMTETPEYFILEPSNCYSEVDSGRHYSQDIHPSKDSLNQPCNSSESVQLHKEATNNLVNTQNRMSNMEYHNYFKLEAHGLEPPLEFTEDTNDTKTAYTGHDISNSVNSHKYFVLKPSASYMYNTIDPKDVDIQTLPDNVYNTTHIKPNEVVKDPNYDSLNSKSQEEIENNINEYSHTQKRSKQEHDIIDYSHINIMRQNDC